MKVKLIFEPMSDKERSALNLLGIRPDRCDGTFEWAYVDLDRPHRVLGALIDILKLCIIP